MDVIIAPAPHGMLSSQNGRYHGWALDALLSESIRPWTVSWLGTVCFVLRTHETMDRIH